MLGWSEAILWHSAFKATLIAKNDKHKRQKLYECMRGRIARYVQYVNCDIKSVSAWQCLHVSVKRQCKFKGFGVFYNL